MIAHEIQRLTMGYIFSKIKKSPLKKKLTCLFFPCAKSAWNLMDYKFNLIQGALVYCQQKDMQKSLLP